MVQGEDERTIWQWGGDQQDDEPAVVPSCPSPSKRDPSRGAGGHLQDQPGEEAEWALQREQEQSGEWTKQKTHLLFRSCNSLNTSNWNVSHLTYGIDAEEEVSKKGTTTGPLLWRAKGWGDYLQTDSAELSISLTGFVRYLHPIQRQLQICTFWDITLWNFLIRFDDKSYELVSWDICLKFKNYWKFAILCHHIIKLFDSV